MKCIHCGSDSKYKDRSASGQCPSCHHPFAFEPKLDFNKITDGLFQRIIKDVSGDGAVFFTEKHLWYEFNRRLLSRKTFSCGSAAALLLAVGLTAGAMHVFWPTTAGAGAVLFGAMTVKNPKRKNKGPLYPKVSYGDFLGKYLSKWIHTHGPIEKLLPPQASTPTALPRQTTPDLTAYSFDRALITDHAETAAMLVANNFHFENNCAILSSDGYPYHNAPTIMEMLRRNPQLTVFALHDATMSGCLMARSLREERWFPDRTIRVIDLGLRPRHAIKANMVLNRINPQPLLPELRGKLSAEEMTWLESGNIAEVAVMRPARLMRVLYQSIARASKVTDDSGFVEDDGVFIFVDTGPMMYGDPVGGPMMGDAGAGYDAYASDSFG